MSKKIFKSLSLLFSSITMIGNLYAAPAQVVIIRHAEKPATGPELSTQGWLRANALPQFFDTNADVTAFGSPVALYSGAPQKPGDSIRSIQTLTPYSTKLGLPLITSVKRDEIGRLVEEIMVNPKYQGHTVIICWQHGLIPEMAKEFGADSAPSKWDDLRFDRAWIIRFDGNQVSSFKDIPQHLLPSDSL